MPKTYICIGSFYGGARLETLMRALRSEDFEDYVVLVNEQCGPQRKLAGFACIYNRLVASACLDPSCEYIWILGDDVVPCEGCLAITQSVMEKDPTIGVIFPVEVWKDAKNMLVTMRPFSGEMLPADEALAEGDVEQEQIFAGLACACIRRDAFIATGPMDEEIGRGYCEDLDWGIRLWHKGYRVVNYRRMWFLHERGGTYNRMVAEGMFRKEEPYEAADRVKAKWPWLWNGEPINVTMQRLRDAATRAKQ